MQPRLRIETPEDAAVTERQLATLEERFRAGGGEPAATRDLAREIVRLRMALTSYALRHQVREAHDRHTVPGHSPSLEAP